jgi:hypothetical protein
VTKDNVNSQMSDVKAGAGTIGANVRPDTLGGGLLLVEHRFVMDNNTSRRRKSQ